ncbi:CD47 protein, partial [Zapornia atra]|nr:CD47 protein [Zapornia atra]
GSAQLAFSVTDVVEKTDCNKTVILPCHVINLKENNINVMLVTWKKEGKKIFSFDGSSLLSSNETAFSSARLVSQANLPKGDASLMLSSAQAEDGNYSCEVIESNREGETKMELRSRSGLWFSVVERAVILVLLFSVIGFCATQFIVIALKYEIVPPKTVAVIVGCVTLLAIAVVGTVLFVQDGYSTQNQAGLGLVVVPALFYIPLQYFIFSLVFDSLSQALLALISLHVLGYIIALVGFALSVPACPPLHGSVLISGLAIMAIANLCSLAYVFFM